MNNYRRTTDDKMNCINRCFFEAKNGQVWLALRRMQDLGTEFVDDPKVVYAEGLLRKEYLGQGLKSRELFVKAYELDNNHAFATCNAALFSRNETEFHQWSAIARRAAPEDKSLVRLIELVRANLENNVSYAELLALAAQQHYKAKEFGISAAYAELAALCDEENTENLSALWKGRAECLRRLDMMAEKRYRATMERFVANERLALQEAIKALDQSLLLDEYDAELWNLKAAWCTLSEIFPKAIECANMAIELRPKNYPKPYINKATALWAIDKIDEAHECLETALAIAGKLKIDDDYVQAEKLQQKFSIPKVKPRLRDLEPLILHIVNAARTTSELEIGQSRGSIDDLVRGIVVRVWRLGQNKETECIPLMAELLSDFTPDTVFYTVLKTSEHDQKVHALLLNASLHVIAKSSGVLQQDAARFMVLTLLGALQAKEIRWAYRKGILANNSLTKSDMEKLDSTVRDELGRINPYLPDIVTQQPEIGEEDKDIGSLAITSYLSPKPYNNRKIAFNKLFINSGLKYACAFATGGLISAVSLAYQMAGFYFITAMAAVIFLTSYIASKKKPPRQKSTGGSLIFKFVLLYVFGIFTFPSVIDYFSVWGMLWGMGSIFILQLFEGDLTPLANLKRFFGVFLLCWLYAYALDKGLRLQWGPGPYYIESFYYGLQWLFGALASFTIVVMQVGRIKATRGMGVLLLAALGFFLGDLLSYPTAKFILNFLGDSVNPLVVAITCSQVFSGAVGGFLTGLVSFKSSSKYKRLM